MEYYAYGSNMLEDRLLRRTPSAVYFGVGILQGYLFSFNKQGQDNSGKGTIEQTTKPRDLVYGVVYTIDDSDFPTLDKAEEGYTRKAFDIQVNGNTIKAESYMANPQFIDHSLRPFDWYAALIMAGALEHGLPTAYRDTVLSVPTIRDQNKARRKSALATLGRYQADFEAGRLLALKEGLPAPLFNLEDIHGQRIDLEDFRGRVVLLHFWSMSCQGSQKDFTSLQHIRQKYPRNKLVLLGLCKGGDGGSAKLRTFVEQEHLEWPQICEGNGWADTVFKLYNITGIPRGYILDQNLHIAFKGIDRDGFEGALDSLIQ
jgi:peroxiredoxin